MNKRILVIILIISVAINLVAVFTLGYYWWEIRSHKRGFIPNLMERGHDWHKSPLRHELNLTEEQIEVLNKNQEEMRAKMLPIKEELFTKRKELMELFKEGELDKSKADSLFGEIASLQSKLEAQVFDNLCCMREIFTPEQQKELEILLHTLFDARRPSAPSLPHMPHYPHGHMP